MRAATWKAPLAAAIAIIVIAHPVAAQYNVALHRPYTADCEIMDQWTGLVDGVVDSDTSPGCFATGNEDDFPKTVTIDLQRPCSINRIAVHNSTNGNTRGLVISCSEDGVNFEELRQFIFPQAQPITLNHRFQDRPAQFVRIMFTNSWGGGLGGDYRIYVREVEVFGAPTDGMPVELAPPAPVGDPLVRTRDLRLFRRWVIEDDGPLTMALLGDSAAACGEDAWPQIVAERLEFARPDGAAVTVAAMTEDGLSPEGASGHLGMIVEEEPHLVMVSFGSDMREFERERFRSSMSSLLARLLADTEAVVLLIGPVPREDTLEVSRRVLREMERVADALNLPLLRTEAALARADLTEDQLRDEDGALSEAARNVIATGVLELLLQPSLEQ